MRRQLVLGSAALLTVLAVPATAAPAGAAFTSLGGHTHSAARSALRTATYPMVDRSFGRNGTLQVNVGTRPVDIWTITRSGQRLYIGGNVGAHNVQAVVIALHLDGSLVRSFGDRGVSYLGSGYSGVDDMAVQTDGKIVATTFQRMTVATGFSERVLRLQANGRLDPTYGDHGRTLLAHRVMSLAQLSLDGAGRAVVVFAVDGPRRNIGNTTTKVARLTRTGQIDKRFGTAGVTVAARDHAVPTAMTLDAQGRALVAVGGYWDGDPIAPVRLVRLTRTGAVDKTTSYRVQDSDAGSWPTGVDVDPKGRITLGLTGYTNAAIGVVRLDRSMTLDPTYGQSGSGEFLGTCNVHCGVTSLLTPWGELFLGATYNKQFTRSDPSYLGQVLPDGSGLDPAFGTAGQWSHQFAPQQMEGLVAGVRIGNAMVFVGHTGTYARLATSGAFLTRVRMR